MSSEAQNVNKQNAPNLPTIHFPKYQPRPYIGKTILWIESWQKESLVYRVIIKTLLLFTCIGLCASVIGIPLFTWGYREWIQLSACRYYEQKFKTSLEQANHAVQKAQLELQQRLDNQLKIDENLREELRMAKQTLEQLQAHSNTQIETKA